MSSTIANYTIEIPGLARVHFCNRRIAIAMATASTLATVLVALCLGYAMLTAVAAHQRVCHTAVGHTAVSYTREAATGYGQDAVDCRILGPADQERDNRAVYIYVARDPTEEAHGAHLWTCPYHNETAQGCSYLYHDTEERRLNIRIQVGPAVVVQIRRQEY